MDPLRGRSLEMRNVPTRWTDVPWLMALIAEVVPGLVEFEGLDVPEDPYRPSACT